MCFCTRTAKYQSSASIARSRILGAIQLNGVVISAVGFSGQAVDA
jgi:hypothetical protein